MRATLSVIVPVCNAQSIVGSMIGELLEVLPEVSPQFDLVVVDDGSVDATGELIHEITGQYPQVSVAHLPTQQGLASAIRAGLERTTGELVMICTDPLAANLLDIGKLYQAAATHDVVTGRLGSRAIAGWIPRLPGASPSVERAGLMIVRRPLVSGWQWGIGSEDLLSFLVRHGHKLYEVDIRDRRPMVRIDELADQIAGKLPSNASRTAKPAAATPKSTVPRPKHTGVLARLRDLALGE
ncbi:MAG: glycosyltransferase [Planctomycetes bacterium]|nr:glycosyltransferase [Planctomycetota bacterium]